MILNVSTTGVREMTTEEMRSTDGGLLWFLPLLLLAGCATTGTTDTGVNSSGSQPAESR